MWGFAEGEFAARAARLATPADITNLRYIDDRLLELRDPADGDGAVEVNRELHAAIRRIADAPKIEWFAHAARRLVPYDFSFEFHRIPGWWDSIGPATRPSSTPLPTATTERSSG